jgi:tetratricopeptide (TPR) repeat protein
MTIGMFFKVSMIAHDVALREEEKRNPNFIEVSHGHLRVNVPLTAYEGTTYHIRSEEAERLKSMLASRYPWLTPNALTVFIEEAEQAMYERILSQMGYMEKARNALRSGNHERAKKMAEKQLQRLPNDADAWYVLGESLCRMGESEKGFAALAKGRSYAKRK